MRKVLGVLVLKVLGVLVLTVLAVLAIPSAAAAQQRVVLRDDGAFQRFGVGTNG